MPDSDITELTELDARKVSGVERMANGTPFLLLKSSDEADEQEDEMTKGEGDLDDGDEDDAMENEMTKAKLTAADRKKIPKKDFAVPEKAPGSGSYPIEDRSHAANALARASGKPVEAKVKRAVRRKYPDMGKKSPGVPEGSTRVEQSMEGGRVKDTGRSGQRIAPMATSTTGSDPVQGSGMHTLDIPNEDKLTHVPPAHLTAKAMSLAALCDAMDRIERQREIVAKADFEWFSQGNPSTPAPDSEVPGSPAWEQEDSVTLKQVAENLASCSKAIDYIAGRELKESETDPSDAQDYWDLANAAKCLDIALGVVARLSYLEGADSLAQKAGVALSGQAIAALQAAHQQLTGLLNQQSANEEEAIMTTVTKEELSSAIAQSSVAAVKEAMEEAKKAAKKSAKKAAKAEAKKNANNGGDITAGDLTGAVHGQHDSNDVEAVGGPVMPKYKNATKGKGKKALRKQLAKLQDAQKATLEMVEKFAARPRAGGPVLDGVPRGAFAANEGRQGGAATKSTAQVEIDNLQKQYEAELQKTDAGAADRAAAMSWQLTRMQLREGHLAGEI